MRVQIGRRPLYAGFFFTACLSAVYILCYQPLQREVAQQREITSGQQQELAEVEHFLQLHPDMNSFRGELDRRSAAISAMLPSTLMSPAPSSRPHPLFLRRRGSLPMSISRSIRMC